MEERLDPQLQLNALQRKAIKVSEGGRMLDESLEEAVLLPEVQALISRCMAGTEPRHGEFENDRKTHQVLTFNPQHVQIVLLRAAGFKQVEIALALGVTQVTVSNILAHIYAKKILHALVPEASSKVIDIRSRMERYAGELMDRTFELAMESKDVKEVKEVTFGLLDRAGYNVITKTATAQVKPKELDQQDAGILSRLASAMEESGRIEEHVMPNWSKPVPPDDSSMPPDARNYDQPQQPVPVSGWDPVQPASAQPQGEVAPLAGGSQRTGTHN